MDNNLISFRTKTTTQNNFISFGLKILGPSTLAFALDKINYLSPLAQIGSRFSASIILPGALGITTYLLSRVILNCQTFKSLAQRPIPKALVDIAITTVVGAVFKALATLIFAKSQVVIIPTVIFGILLGTGIYFINQIASNCLSGKGRNSQENNHFSISNNSFTNEITNNENVNNQKNVKKLNLAHVEPIPTWMEDSFDRFDFDTNEPYFELEVNVSELFSNDKSTKTTKKTTFINYLKVELNDKENEPNVKYGDDRDIDITENETFIKLAPQIVKALEGSKHKEALEAWEFLAKQNKNDY